MSEIINSSSKNQAIKDFFIPSRLEWVWLASLSGLLLTALNYQAVWQLVAGESVDNTAAVSPLVEPVSDFFAQGFFASITVFLLWAFIGCLSYAIIWSIQHFIWRLKTDVSGSTYVKPINDNSYWSSRLAQYTALASFGFVLLVMGMLFVSRLLPAATKAVGELISSGFLPANIGTALLSFLGVMVSLYVLWRLWRAFTYTLRLNFAQETE